MFLTVTLPSYGPVTPSGAPRHPDRYDYRRAALDALHFPKLAERLWENLRRCAGYNVQYFGAIEAQKRLAGHLHVAIRGAIARQILRQVVAATYHQVWWPSFDRLVCVERIPVWDGTDYIDGDTGEVLPTWRQAMAQVDVDPDARPAHVLRFGVQLDMAGIDAGSEKADRVLRYLTKYLAKSIADTYIDPDGSDPAYEQHIDRLHEELRWLPCTPRCANWLRYGIQPEGAGPGLIPGRCAGKAHDRENLGLGGRRILVSRQWSGKPSPSTRPTALRSLGRPYSPPGSRHPRLNGWPPPSPCPTDHLGSSGPTQASTPTATSGSSSTQSLNGCVGAPNTKLPRLRYGLWTVVRQLTSHPECSRPADQRAA